VVHKEVAIPPCASTIGKALSLYYEHARTRRHSNLLASDAAVGQRVRRVMDHQLAS